MGSTNLRARFTDTMISTASRERLVTMCYDRVVRDLHESIAAIEAGHTSVAHHALVHAQELIAELERAVDVALWPPGRDLVRLYGFVRSRLLDANLHKTVLPVKDCLSVIEPLATAWHEAYRSRAASGVPT